MNTFFINLEQRHDRLRRMETELSRVGLHGVRVRALKPQDYRGNPADVEAMQRRTPGSIGNFFSHTRLLAQIANTGQDALVFEDDVRLASDFQERLAIIQEWTSHRAWDIVWLGGTFHINPPFWHPAGPSGMEPDCSAHLGRDAERTDHPRILRTYGAFCTYAYLVNHLSIPRMLDLIAANTRGAIGLDWLFIKLQPQLQTFAFVPGSARQINDKSDVSNGQANMDVFARLNGGSEAKSSYFFQDRMSDFDPETFDWAETQC